ncbi:MAG TPA: sigma-70 family RNA polymerase sigma factor [Pyrinomonadaceae bacterium]|nr:sigma-70 family RNA polymerase sigma factor [Pyrinomonadaceae bacterium]
MSQRSKHIESLLAAGAKRLLARVSDSRSLDSETVQTRVRAVVEKYLLRDDPNASGQSITGFIDGLQADDLCLILACERGDETAWSELVERFTPTVRSAARSASGNEEGAEDLAQSIWAELYGLRIRDDGQRASKLAYYSGRGSLAGWLRAVVAQLAVDYHRKQSRLVQTEEDADFDRLSRDSDNGKEQLTHGTVNPETEIADKLAGREMQEALARSICDLSAEDRLLVKLYYLDGLRLREAGAVLGVHEATASRRLTKIHGELRNRVESILIDDRGWTKAETKRSFAEVALHLETDLEPLLASGATLNKVETGASNGS